MKFRFLAAATTALGLIAMAGSANALITVSLPLEVNDLYGVTLAGRGQVMLDDFDSINSPSTTYTGLVRATQNPITNSAAPPYTGPGSVTICCANGIPFQADPTNYASVQANALGTYSIVGGAYLTAFSFYMGSPDTYNQVQFNLRGGGSQLFTGANIWGGNPPGNGNRATGYRVYYNFNGAQVTSINFRSIASNAFEFDGLAGSLAVPEPSTWALMISGFGMAGAMLRSRRRALAAA